MVTGASRGIGAAAAVALAKAGYHIALAARTMVEPGLDAVSPGDDQTIQVRGSLASTAAAVEAHGVRALPIRMDLTDLDSVLRAVDQTQETLGPIDVLVNNAIYQGPGNMEPLLGTPLELIETTLRADVIAPTALLQRVLPPMIERRRGVVINVTSAVAFLEPPGGPGAGGWGYAYGIAKGGFDRIAGLVNAETPGDDVIAYNVEPGFVAYGEKLKTAATRYPGLEITPPEAIGAVIAWLATSPEAVRFKNKRVHGPQLFRSLELGDHH
jgi:NAD(P)-dependent dehydrogenase (short-subunit alcohol dehydrogenase family)